MAGCAAGGGVNVSAVIVTRGDCDLSRVLDSLPRDWQKVVWDNSKREQDLAVYGRYAAIEECEHDLIVTVDDDVAFHPESCAQLVDAYEPGHVVCNMPQRFRDTGFYDDHALVGFGAILDRELPEQAFTRFALSSHRNGCIAWGAEGVDRSWFDRTCDVVFTALTPRILVDLPYTDLAWASAPNRMWKTEGHIAERTRMLELVRAVRDA
jgi:hypothetical protein